MSQPSERQLKVAALESEHPAWMVFVEHHADGEPVWIAARWDGCGDLIAAPDPDILGKALAEAADPQRGVVATDPGGWISGPAMPTEPARTRPMLTEAIAASMRRGRGWLS